MPGETENAVKEDKDLRRDDDSNQTSDVGVLTGRGAVDIYQAEGKQQLSAQRPRIETSL